MTPSRIDDQVHRHGVDGVFFERVKPVSTIAKPSCMNITRKPAISSHARFSELSSGGDDAAVCARGEHRK